MAFFFDTHAQLPGHRGMIIEHAGHRADGDAGLPGHVPDLDGLRSAHLYRHAAI